MNQPTYEEVVEARDQCAKIILKYGERYLPIFERLEIEVAALQKKQEVLERVRKIACKNATQNATQIATQKMNSQNKLKFLFNKYK